MPDKHRYWLIGLSLACVAVFVQVHADYNHLNAELDALEQLLNEIYHMAEGDFPWIELPCETTQQCADELTAVNLLSRLYSGTTKRLPAVPHERAALERTYDEVRGTLAMKLDRQWLETGKDSCDWVGIRCEPHEAYNVVVAVELERCGLDGTMPRAVAQLEHLRELNLAQNGLMGSIPSYSNLTNLVRVKLSRNRLNGTLPLDFLASANNLQELRLGVNKLTGQVSDQLLSRWHRLRWLDLGDNRFSGPLSRELSFMTDMDALVLGNNMFTSTLPSGLERLTGLSVLDVGGNLLQGALPDIIGDLSRSVATLNLAGNAFYGSIPEDIFEFPLRSLLLSDNDFTGTLPPGTITDVSAKGTSWLALETLWLEHNHFSGTLPVELFVGLKETLFSLSIGHNEFTGTIPTEIGLLRNLTLLDARSNQLRGSLPRSMSHMDPNLRLNFTGNLLIGTIPGMFCGEGAPSRSMLYREFGCDAVLCRAGTFSSHGHATLHSGCRPCPSTPKGEQKDPPESTILGRLSCDGTDYIEGDWDADGVLSPREILRMIFINTVGQFWGIDYQKWADMTVNECELTGITCSAGHIGKIDLSNANLCSDGSRKASPIAYCKGLPSEVGLLTHLEVLQLTRRQYLRGTLPTEIGNLSKLRFLDLSSCVYMGGTLPSEMGRLSNLRLLKIVHTQFKGTIPSELFTLKNLEILHLTNCQFSGPLPPTKMFNLKEFMIARNKLTGTIPFEIGYLTNLENFEGYHNQLTGHLPESLSLCTALKRIDLFHNELTGTIPEIMTLVDALQILHLKENLFTGTIPEFGRLPTLTWLDLSKNLFRGTVPASLGTSRSIENVHLGGNMLYEPIPRGLCNNPNVNGGATKTFGCDEVLCPLGTYADNGHAADPGGCTKCPEGQTTLYLGSTKHECKVYTPESILSMFFQVARGDGWPEESKHHWADESMSLCDWAGVTCNEEGEMTSLTFPLVGLDDY